MIINSRETLFPLNTFLLITVRMRLKSVKNIQKITQSMKMVSAAKYARAERDLKSARSFGEGAQGLVQRQSPNTHLCRQSPNTHSNTNTFVTQIDSPKHSKIKTFPNKNIDDLMRCWDVEEKGFKTPKHRNTKRSTSQKHSQTLFSYEDPTTWTPTKWHSFCFINVDQHEKC